jgi:hypothetical protein
MKAKKGHDKADEFIDTVINMYKTEALDPLVGVGSQVQKNLTSALEGILKSQIHLLKDPEFRNLEQIRAYTKEEVLNMYVEDFVEAHPFLHGKLDVNKRYFLMVGAYVWRHLTHKNLFWKDLPKNQIKVWQVVRVNPDTITDKIEKLGDRTVSGVKNYLKSNYDIDLGKDYFSR